MPSILFVIEGEITDLNTYVNAERSNRFQGAKIKKLETARCKNLAIKQKLKKIPSAQYVLCTWYTPDKRKDHDNIAFSLKFILDGLVDAKVIPGDSPRYIGSLAHNFEIDKKRPRVEVLLETE